MPNIQSEIIILGDKTALFNLTQNYNIRLNWDPFLKEARLIGPKNEVKIGTRALCVSKSGIGMEIEYIFVQEPQVAAMKMTKGPFILKSFAGSWRFIKIDDFSTRVIFRYHFSSRFKTLEPILKIIFNNQMKKRLKELKMKFENHEIT
ncbi:MAG: SRPBCC family protein [Candidatus Cohnella colombiensis]|uniref:SRPBCC family protein n=1 Tax=Candidatus Cohnella colombiensis TaxID=3121368 RepID=A0AA95F1P4_9BACL|nr:MAG: SRPBCC family protein [Cohnella sp.]